MIAGSEDGLLHAWRKCQQLPLIHLVHFGERPVLASVEQGAMLE